MWRKADVHQHDWSVAGPDEGNMFRELCVLGKETPLESGRDCVALIALHNTVCL